MSGTERNLGRMGGIGAVAGVAAYLLGYLVVYATQREAVDERLRGFNVFAELLGGDPIPPWQAIGWLFYNAHAVGIELPSWGGGRTENLIANADDGTLALLYLVPPVLLLGAGFATAVLSRVDTTTAGGLAGALVVAGYLPLAVAGTVVFEYALVEGAIAPEPVTAAFLAGVVYPVAFGGIGGVIGAELTGHG